MKYAINDQLRLMRPPEGPLAAYVRPFSNWISERGYARCSLRQRIRLAAGFSHWLGCKALSPPDIDSRHCAQFLRYRAQYRKGDRGDALALSQFREFLCEQGLIVAEEPAAIRLTPVQRYTQDFERYLREERLLHRRRALTTYRSSAGFSRITSAPGPSSYPSSVRRMSCALFGAKRRACI